MRISDWSSDVCSSDLRAMAKDKPLRLAVKRAYDPPASADGQRVLVDRVWPRGVTKEALRLAVWLKEAAPSTALRKWFGHDPAKWDGFRTRYFRELDAQPEAVAQHLASCERSEERRVGKGGVGTCSYGVWPDT